MNPAMARRSSPFDEWLSFGGRVPPVVGGLIIAIVGCTIVGALAGVVPAFAAFVPALVLRGEVWRLVTWPFVEGRDPLSLIFGALTLYWFGRDLTWAWGPRRFLVTFLAIAGLSAAATTLLSLVVAPLGDRVWLGAWPVLSALIVGWAMLFPERQILFMFALPISGRALAWITVGGTLLYAVLGGRGGAWSYVPHLLAQGFMALYLRGFSARGMWQTLKIRSLERRARRRASHLKVVHKDGDGSPPRWMN
jgi:membrane associated rhomboid family serine protease